jgi:hypothetical protein
MNRESREHRLIYATLQQNVAKRKAARVAANTPAPAPTQAQKTTTTRAAIIRTPETQPAPAPTPLPQKDPGFELRGAGNPVYQTEEQLTESFRSQETRRTVLDQQLSEGKISQNDYNREIGQMFTEDQYKISLERLGQGFSGVDPLGFGGPSTVANRGPYKTQQEAQDAANEEYRRTGTISPETQAALDSFENPQEYRGAQYRPRTESQRSAQKIEESRAQALELAKQDTGTRMKNAGLSELDQKLFEVLRKYGTPGMGTASGRVSFSGVSQEFRDALRAAGIGFNETPTGDREANAKGLMNIVLSMGSDEFRGKQQLYDKISSGGDIDDILGKLSSQAQSGIRGAAKEGQASQIQEETKLPSMMDFVMPEIEDTYSKIAGSVGNSMGIQQDVFSAYLPLLTAQFGAIQSIRQRASSIDTFEERSSIAEAQIAPEKALALRRENQLISQRKEAAALLKENRDILVENNRLTTEALEIDKKIFQEKARISEVRQIALNLEGEKKLRRSMSNIGIGIGSSPNAVEFLQGKILEAADALQSMITTNSLASLKFTNARDQLNNSLRSTINEFDGKMAALNSNFDDNIFNLDQFVSGARSAVLKDLKDDWMKLTEKEDALMIEAGKTIQNAKMESIRIQLEHDKINKKESMTAKDKLGFVSSLRAGIGTNKIITLAKDVDGFYGAFNAGYDEYKFLLEEIAAGRMKEGDISLNPSQSGAIGSLARMFDPGSVVRNEEYERQVLGQSAPAIISGWFQKLKAGGTGLTPRDLDAMKRVAEGLHRSWEEKLSNEMQPFILDIQDWNSNYPDAQILYEQVIPVDRVHLPSQTIKTWGDAAGWSALPSLGTGATRSNLNTNSSLHDFFSVYAPSSDNNNPKAYAEDVAKKLGVTKDTKLGDLIGMVPKMAQAIADHEGFTNGSSRLARVNNNPGNLKYIGQSGAVEGEKGFARFVTLEDGWNALENDIRAKIGTNSIARDSNVASAYYSAVEIDPSSSDPIEISGEEYFSSILKDPSGSVRKEFIKSAGARSAEFSQEFGATFGDLAKFAKWFAQNRVEYARDVIKPFSQGFSESYQ